ncbi:MAG: DUF92 domain-containing protein [Pedobacter sp.]|nr:DUF92 domain-containing protein [Pedobacter sp.]
MIALGTEELLLAAFLVAVMAICLKFKKLTFSGALAAGIIGLCVFLADQWRGILLLLVFFILSVVATSYKKDFKLKLQSQSVQNNGRTAGQVFANGGVAAICALFCIIDPAHLQFYLIMMSSSLASALADTLSSELGIVYGRRFYNILTLKQDTNGLDGVVSIEGTVLGAIGAFIVGLSFATCSTISLLIGIAGILGNLSDSVIGASLERRGIIGNNFVNFLNTLFAAILGLLFYLLIY